MLDIMYIYDRIANLSTTNEALMSSNCVPKTLKHWNHAYEPTNRTWTPLVHTFESITHLTYPNIGLTCMVLHGSNTNTQIAASRQHLVSNTLEQSIC